MSFGRANLYVTGLQGLPARRLFVEPAAEGNNAGATSPAFSPDGKWLAYTVAYGRKESRIPPSGW